VEKLKTEEVENNITVGVKVEPSRNLTGEKESSRKLIQEEE
jgi:hypothetical protein